MRRVGPYAIVGELGRGGMGVVYRARRDGDVPDVALKVIAAGEDASPEALARFQREVRIARKFDHPGIVTVLDAGQDGDAAWFAMDLIEGEPLSTAIKEREFTWEQAVGIVRDVADALAVAHEQGVLHRDLKPSNILMDADGNPHIADFGLAKDTRTGSKYTRTGQTLGTPAYMSPEQARGDLAQLTPASDVWALGCVLYELLSNRRAFEGDTAAAVIGQILTAAPQRLTGVPTRVQQLVAASTARSPDSRPTSAGESRDECIRLLSGERLRTPAPRRARRNRLAVMLAGGGVLLAAIALAWPPADAPPVGTAVDPHATQLAARGWDLRRSFPERALKLLREAHQIEPGHAEWRLRLGELAWAHGSIGEAREALHGVGESAPEFTAAMWLLGLLEETLRKGTDAHRDSAPVRTAWARAAAGHGASATRAQAGLAFLDQHLDDARGLLSEDNSWSAALLLGMVETDAARKHKNGDWEPARRALERALETGPTVVFALSHLGLACWENSRFDAAIEHLDRALTIDPNYEEALNNRSTLLERLKRFDDALRDRDHLVALHPGDPKELRARAHLLLEAKRYAEGIRDYSAVLEATPEDWLSLMKRGRCYSDSGNQLAAIADYNRMLELRPNQILAIYYRSQALGRLRRYDDALNDLDAILRIDPEYTYALRSRAQHLWVMKRWPEAERAWTTLLNQLPDDVRALRKRYRTRRGIGDLAGAQADLDRLIKLEGGTPQLLAWRAELHRKRGDLDAARADLEAALKLDPYHWEARLSRGRLRQSAGDTDGAIEDFTTILERHPDKVEARVARALLHQQAGRIDDALADMNAVVAARPGGWAYRNRTVLLKHMGDYEGALQDLTMAIKLRPRSAEAHYDRGNIYLRQGHPTKALAAFGVALELDPNHVDARINRGVTRGNTGDPAGAYEDLRHAVRLRPNLGGAQLLWGRACLRLRKWSEAITAFKAVLALPPVRTSHDEARRGLAMARAEQTEGR